MFRICMARIQKGFGPYCKGPSVRGCICWNWVPEFWFEEVTPLCDTLQPAGKVQEMKTVPTAG